MQNEELLIDEAMMTVEEMVGDLISPVEEMTDHEEQVSLSIHQLELDMPIQLEVVVKEDGSVLIGTTPPLYKLETSFEPVFHQLRFSFQKLD
jgi:hypothetical protein